MSDETYAKMRALWQVCEEWICEHEVECGESLYQVDSINEDLPELGIKICEIVGYCDPGDE